MGRIKQYQDEWVSGECARPGYRECSKRYEVIRQQVAGLGLDAPRVLDFGADRGYFSLRLAEDFGARSLAVEADAENLTRVVAENGTANVGVLHERITDPDRLRGLGTFDVTLAMSVLHHVEDYAGFLDALQDMARSLAIVEVPHPDERIDRSKTPRIPGLHEEACSRGEVIGDAPAVSGATRRRTILALPGRAE